MRLNSKLAMNMTENTHLYKHVIMYKKIYINMLTQKDELAVAKTHHDIESLNLRPFSIDAIGEQLHSTVTVENCSRENEIGSLLARMVFSLEGYI